MPQQSELFDKMVTNGCQAAPPDERADSPASTVLLPPQDAVKTLEDFDGVADVVMLDPWYNRGVGGVQDDYHSWLSAIVALAGSKANHVFVWGFPEIVCNVLARLPSELSLVSWLTWYYKNCPSVIRGWRSAQYACLHLSRPDAPLHPEHFLNEAQLEKRRQGKLRYLPGPTSVIEAPLNIGFVGKGEQTGHPAQKPESVYDTLYRMTTVPGDFVVDPMCGAGTTGAVCRRLGVHSLLCDASEEYTTIVESRLGIKRAKRTNKRPRRSASAHSSPKNRFRNS